MSNKILRKEADVKSFIKKRLLTVEEAAEFLSISPRTIYNKIGRKAQNRFPVKPLRVGKCIRFDIEDLVEYVKILKSRSKNA